MTGRWPVDIEALTPTSVGTVVWRHAGRTTLTIVLKQTFSLDEGKASPVRPDELCLEERLGPTGSPIGDADIAPYKPRAEVTYVGHAHSSAPVTQLTTRIAVHAGNAFIDKPLSVVGERATPAAPPTAFTRMSLTWERALSDQNENPIGASPASGRIPNVFDPQDPRAPACYAPLSRTWGTRRRFIGRGDPARAAGLRPEMPADLSWGFFLAAPQDQQINRLNGNEIIVLENLLEGRPRVRTQIPGARGLARVYGGNAPQGGAPIELRLDTMAFDGDRSVVSLLWRGTMSIQDEAAAQSLRILGAVELAGQAPVTFPAQPGPRAAENRHGAGGAPAPKHPFEGTMQIGKALIDVPKLHEDGVPLYDLDDEPSSVAGSTMAIDPEEAMRLLAGRALPFGGSPPAPPPPAPPPPAPPPPAPPPPAPPPPGPGPMHAPPNLAPPPPPPPPPALAAPPGFGPPPVVEPAGLRASPPMGVAFPAPSMAASAVVVRPSATFVADDEDSVGSTMAITPEAAQELLARQAAKTAGTRSLGAAPAPLAAPPAPAPPIAAQSPMQPSPTIEMAKQPSRPPAGVGAPRPHPMPAPPAQLPPGFGPPPPMPVAASPLAPLAPPHGAARPPVLAMPAAPPPPPPPDPDEGGGSTMILDVEQLRRR